MIASWIFWGRQIQKINCVERKKGDRQHKNTSCLGIVKPKKEIMCLHFFPTKAENHRFIETPLGRRKITASANRNPLQPSCAANALLQQHRVFSAYRAWHVFLVRPKSGDFERGNCSLDWTQSWRCLRALVKPEESEVGGIFRPWNGSIFFLINSIGRKKHVHKNRNPQYDESIEFGSSELWTWSQNKYFNCFADFFQVEFEKNHILSWWRFLNPSSHRFFRKLCHLGSS